MAAPHRVSLIILNESTTDSLGIMTTMISLVAMTLLICLRQLCIANIAIAAKHIAVKFFIAWFIFPY
jgi:hypothetical protein